jgi:type I restriction enzyme S subunit
MNAVDEFLGKIGEMQVRPFAEVRKGYTYFEEGDVLFAKITPCMENGKAAIAKGLIDGIGFGSTEFHVLRPSPEVVAEWVWYFVRREVFRNRAKESFRGGVGQQRVPQDFLESQLLPLPPLEEQRRIVAKVEALMARVQEARRLRAEAEKDAERLMQAALAEVFPCPGAALPQGWRWARLGEVCEIWDNLRRPVKKKLRNPGEIPYCGANGVIDYVSGYTHEGEFVLLAEDGGFYGPGDRTAYLMRGRFWANNHVHIVRGKPDLLTNTFLLYWLIATDLHPYLTGATRPKLTQSAMRNLLIPLPPLEEQRRIVAYLDQVQQQVTALKHVQTETEAELKRLEQAILDRAFGGELQ